MTEIIEKILDVLEGEQLDPSDNVTAMCDKILSRHPDRVRALVYYGSSLRAMNDPGKMLDFYVLVDSYRKTHKNPVRALLNALLPPSVYYLENVNSDGSVSTCKYSIISIKAFENRCRKAFLTIVWGRFSQPCVLLFPKDESTKQRVQRARAGAITHLSSQTAPLFTKPMTVTQFWARGFMESYQTELRPESSQSRSEEIVDRYVDRYRVLMSTIFGKPENDGNYHLPSPSKAQTFYCKWKWGWRRLLGKPYAGLRVLNSAFTFDGGLDYVLHKLKNHSGKTIDVTEGQRRHPILWSPILAWKLYKIGAFK